MTLLAALAARAIAVPMSPAFPDPELQYILDHSQASLLVSSSKFASQARQVLAGPLEAEPRHLELPKHVGGRQGAGDAAVTLEGSDPGRAGLMLYTSGTTSKPVCCSLILPFLISLRVVSTRRDHSSHLQSLTRVFFISLLCLLPPSSTLLHPLVCLSPPLNSSVIFSVSPF